MIVARKVVERFMHPILAKIPFLRRPFYQLETARRERDLARQERDLVRQELVRVNEQLETANVECVVLRSGLRATASNFEVKLADRRQSKTDSSFERRCVFCNNKVDAWRPFRMRAADISNFLTTLESVGSNVERFECPHCASIDRERHLRLYLERLRIMETVIGGAVLHMAPELRLRGFIESHELSLYVRGDLTPSEGAVQKIDLQQIPYPDQTFDLIICNHILEHVDNAGAALREMYRVLKPGGRAICQTPFALRLAKTLEGSPHQSADERLYFYGQEDHVRLFGNDIEQVFHDAGFVGHLVPHDELLPDIHPEIYGVNEHEPFFDFGRELSVVSSRGEEPLVSIIMLCYNHDNFVGEALDGLFAQTYSPLEIVIIDDGSSDGTAKVIETKLAQHSDRSNIEFIRNERNIGANAAMRIGLNRTTGQFIHLASSDDIMLPDFIACMARAWREDNVSLVATNAYYIDEHSSSLNRTFRDPSRPGDASFETLARDGANDCCFGPAIGFDREIHSQFGWPPTYLNAYDIMYPFYACLLKGERFLEEPLLKYRVNSQNTSLSLTMARSDEPEQAVTKERMFYGHMAHALLMQETLEKLQERMPERYSSVAEKIGPLLKIQLTEMARKFAKARRELEKIQGNRSSNSS
jgi:glycosyltransferase involved in cell wall biosynthesis/SAM-dependent methyltransferase